MLDTLERPPRFAPRWPGVQNFELGSKGLHGAESCVERSAQLVRPWNAQVKSSLQERQDFQILYGVNGGRLLRRAHPDWDGSLFLSERSAATADFVREVAGACLRTYAKIQLVRAELVAVASRNAAAEGLPLLIPGEKLLGRLIRRIWDGPTAASLIQEMRIACGFYDREYEIVRIDSTVKIYNTIPGQVPEGLPGPRASNHKSRVLTVKGRTGTLVGAELAPSEGLDQVVQALLCSVPLRFRGAVKCIGTDAPSVLPGGRAQLESLFPALLCIEEDPMHAVCRILLVSDGSRMDSSNAMKKGVMALFGRGRRGEGYVWKDTGEGAEALAELESALPDLDLGRAHATLNSAGDLPLVPASWVRVPASVLRIAREANEATRGEGKGKKKKKKIKAPEAEQDVLGAKIAALDIVWRSRS